VQIYCPYAGALEIVIEPTEQEDKEQGGTKPEKGAQIIKIEYISFNGCVLFPGSKVI
jgi:hypothetical protein